MRNFIRQRNPQGAQEREEHSQITFAASGSLHQSYAPCSAAVEATGEMTPDPANSAGNRAVDSASLHVTPFKLLAIRLCC